MRKLITFLILLVCFVIPVQAHAQANIHFSSVSVDIWPEYDQPGVLIIYHIQLASDTVLPADIALRIPSAAQVNAVAVNDTLKGLITTPYDSTVQGDTATVKLTTNSLQLQVEYYISLYKDNSTRRIVYKWEGDNPVDTLDVNFLLPPASDHLKIDPSPLSSAPGQGGLTNYLVRAANLEVGQTYTVAIEYQRQTDELSIASLPVQAVSTPGTTTPGHTSSPLLIPWLLGGLGALLIVGTAAGYLGWRKGSHTGKDSRSASPSSSEAQEEAVYCEECGKRAQPGDAFCRTCGTRLKQNKQS
jgi:hypothetical protein